MRFAGPVAAGARVLPEATELARDVAANAAPLSVAVTKQLLWSTWVGAAGEVEALEAGLHRFLNGAA